MSLAALSKLSGFSQGFLPTVRGGTKDRNSLIALAVARAVVDRLALPSSPVEDFNAYFSGQYKGQVEQLTGEINELVTVDIPQALEYVCVLWKMRYKTLHPSGRLFSNGQDNFMSFLGLSSLMTADFAKLVVLNEADLLHMSNGFRDLLCDLVPIAEAQADAVPGDGTATVAG